MHHPKGFTLVELVVAAAVFATVMVVTVNLFVVVLRKPLQQIDEQHVQEDATYFFEVLANMLNNMTIDYGAYGGTVTNPTTELHLKSLRPGSNEQIRMYLDNGQVLGGAEFGSFPITTTPDVVIDSLKFYVYPVTDPTTFTSGSNFQPSFVIQITGHPTNDASRSFSAQTFISLQPYVR